MRLRAPADCRSVYLNGSVLTVAVDGTVDIDDQNIEALSAHGFAQAGTQPSVNQQSINTDSFTQKEFIQFLKDRGIAVPLPATNEKLRALAKQILSKETSGRRRL